MSWSWNHSADEIWKRLDPELWELTGNPWLILQSMSKRKLEGLKREFLTDTAFRQRVEQLLAELNENNAAPSWFQTAHASTALRGVAYFSMEYMLSEALPIYSGGLGNVAGDQLKAASDLGVPVVGVGLLYQQGYFRQVIDGEGAQQALFPYNDPGQLPITPVRQPDGEWLRLEVALPGYAVWLRAWQVQVGRLTLYLLDSNDAANFPAHRGITSELYGGGLELRLKQELLLGIGGWRLLRALGVRPEVCHLNEGHAAFAVLERARSFMDETGQPFAVALTATRAGNLFTTHTPVAAGFDRFPPALIAQYLARYAETRLGLSLDALLGLGRQNPSDPSEEFNMAYLAVRGSGAVNGVSRLHGQVSRRLFAPLFPRWPMAEVPVGYVTNGVHMPSWDSAAADALWTTACGQERWRGTTDLLERDIRCASNAELWELRTTSRQALISYARDQLARTLAVAGAPSDAVEAAQHLFDPKALTLGFARRFATYKRPNLLLHDPERLVRLLTTPTRPVQLIVAGKAHPADQPGKALIQEWIRFVRRPEVRPHALFLSDYDMLVAEQMVQGVDVWINTPRRPWEASGTSGMKVLVNGGLNLSELDGWWAEAYAPEVGWALGDGREHAEDAAWDAAEAAALYDLLEREVIPAFYERDANGIPVAWVARMRESMARLTPRFSSNRTVREYTQRYYLPAAAAYRARAAARGALGEQIIRWQQALEQGWSAVRVREVHVETVVTNYAVTAEVHLADVDPDAVQVEVYADGVDGDLPFRRDMQRVRRLPAAAGRYLYEAAVPATRPATDYTVRVIPHHPSVAVPLEAPRIRWPQ
jgi:starch phosphorylase